MPFSKIILLICVCLMEISYQLPKDNATEVIANGGPKEETIHETEKLCCNHLDEKWHQYVSNKTCKIPSTMMKEFHERMGECLTEFIPPGSTIGTKYKRSLQKYMFSPIEEYLNRSHNGRIWNYKPFSELHASLAEIDNILDDIEEQRLSIGIYFHIYNFILENKYFNNSISENNYFNTSENYTCVCFNCEFLEFVQYMEEKVENMHESVLAVFIFQKYFQPIILVIVLTLGLSMDGILLFIFARHKSVRSQPNMIVLNIAICDLLTLLVLLPLEYSLFNGIGNSSKLILPYSIVVSSLSYVSGMSILALSVQRYFVVTGWLKESRFAKIRENWRTLLFIMVVWGPNLCQAVFILARYVKNYLNDYNPSLREITQQTILIQVVTSVINVLCTPLSVIVFNCITSHKLSNTAKNMPGESIQENQQQARYRSARIIYFLCLVFLLTHVQCISQAHS
ncbi:hypothetical protein C0J52_22926 [Blattella germanica]|nr:hypothetical protein C0J52_22926 [Blattella germanica]